MNRRDSIISVMIIDVLKEPWALLVRYPKKQQRCVGELKNRLMKFAKDNGIMKILTKRGYVRSEIVAA